jgi:hypothetical protein
MSKLAAATSFAALQAAWVLAALMVRPISQAQCVQSGRQALPVGSLAGGVERVPIWAVNETEDGELPTCSSLERVPDKARLIHAHLGLTDDRL